MVVEKRAQPFLKWAGGKSQLLPELAKYIPKSYGQYIEPFLGGGALFFYLSPKNAILSDLNEDLVNTYIVVRDNVYELIDELKDYQNDEQFYYKLRNKDLNELDPIKRAARIIYLNKTCYNGLYRVNRLGKFNVPFGNMKNPLICDENKLILAHDALQGVHLICGDYKSILQKYAHKDDFVYLDPPYYPIGGYSDFKRYTKETFYKKDQIELKIELNRLVDIGCNIVLTNSNTDLIRNLYDNYECKIVDTHRNISSNSQTRNGQDLIVIATQPTNKTSYQLNLEGEFLKGHFPGTRFMGSKCSILTDIWGCIKDLHVESVLDAFSGSGCVSYMLKQHGLRVISNDFMHFSFHIAKATVENPNVILNDNDLNMLIKLNSDAGNFISDTFRGLYFSDEENQFLDSLRSNIEFLDNPYKKSLALASISRACMKRRARGIFTYVGNRYDDGRRDMKMSLQEHFIENVNEFNQAVFDNGKSNLSLNSDVFDLDVQADLVYLDPPYFTPHSDNDYTRRYHFVEGLVRQWDGVEIQYNTKTKKFKRYETPFISKDTVYEAFDKLFNKFQDSILVVSYSSNSIPNKNELTDLLKKYKDNVKLHQVEHLYSFGNQGHKVGNNANRAMEYIFVAT